MSDKIKGFAVALEADISQEQADLVQVALSQIRGVLRVEAEVQDISGYIAEARARNELASKLIAVLHPKS